MKKLNTNKFKFFWIKLIRGDFGLITTFWLFGIGVNLIFLLLFNYLIKYDISDSIILITFFIKAIYNLIIFIAIWRAANKYKGLKIWKIFAYISVIFGILLLLIEIFFNLIEFNPEQQLKKTNIFVPTAQIIWEKRFPISCEGAKAITKTNDGNFIITGNSGTNLFIMKINDKGKKIWKHYFNKQRSNNYYSNIIKTNDGGFIVAGDGWNSLFVMKFNIEGKNIWEKSYNNYNSIVKDFSIIKTNDGGFIVAGAGAGSGDPYEIIKINNKGKKIWDNSCEILYDEDDNSYPSSIVKTNDGVLVGGLNKTGVFIMKINNKGKKIWIKYFNNNKIYKKAIAYDLAPQGVNAITKTNDGGFIVAADSLIIKIDNKGKIIWISKLNHLNCKSYPVTKINTIIKTNDGGFVVAGDTGYPGSFVAKVNSNGKEIWGNCFNKTDYYGGVSAIVKTNNGGFIIVGNSEFNDSSKGSFYLIKIKYAKKTLQKE